MPNIRALTDIQLDAVREVGNIGAGHAATALSQLIEKKIMITVPKVLCLPMEKVVHLVGGAQSLIAGVTMHVLGDISAKIVLILPRKSALQMAGLLTKQDTEERQILTMMEHSAIKEAGNILAGAYLNALTEFLGLLLLQSVPQLIFDMAEAVISELSKGFPANMEVICIETEFMESARVIQGYFFLMPDKVSLDVILRATQVPR
ncbi:chemotaxis protein CheC [bacterium]|nr:chemotaxis protein CheC [bacterium]